MTRMLFIALLLCLLFSARLANGAECLGYEPEKVELSGVIVRETFPGPPEFESIEKGDRPETYWILKLFKPVCVFPGKEDDFNEPESDVKAVQLVFMGPANEYEKYRHLVSKKVVAAGTLYHSHTGHHHTKVLMQVISIGEMSGKP